MQVRIEFNYRIENAPNFLTSTSFLIKRKKVFSNPKRRRIIFALFLGIFINSDYEIYAQNKEEKTVANPYELSLEQLGSMVITASKTPQATSKVTQKVDVVTKQQMDQMISGNRNIAEFIQYLPGASVKVLSRNDVNWGAYGGIGPKYNTYLIQGLSIDGFIDPMSIDAMAIQRIEVQRGPASVLYPNYLSQDFDGNQSPLAGTVNLILKEDVIRPQTMISLGYGSYNTYTGQIYHENRFSRLHLFGGISYEKSDYTNYGSDPSWLNMLKNPEYQKDKVFLGASLYLDESEKHKITFFGNQTFHWGDVGRVNREYDNRYSLINFGYTGQWSDEIRIAMKTGLRLYDRSWQEDNYDTNNDQTLRETDGVKQIIIPIDVSISYRHFNNSNLTIGSDYQQSYYQTSIQPAGHDKVTGNDASASQMGAYLQEELQMEKLTLRGGGRFNRVSNDIEKFGGQAPGSKGQSWNVFLWSAGAKYRLAEDWAVFANAGSSFMSPGLKSIGGTLPLSDMFVAGKNGQLPNPNLKPESGIGFDLGFDCKLHSDIFLSIRGFNSTISDAIIDNVISQNPSQTMSINAGGKTKVQGFEIGCKQYLEKEIDWFANITLTKSEIVSPNDPDQDGVEVPFVPNIMGNLGVTFYLPYSIEVSPWVHFGGRIYDSNSRTSRNYFDSKELVNIIALKTFDLNEDQKLDVFIRLYNITDNKFDMPWQFRDPGFSCTIGARVNFMGL